MDLFASKYLWLLIIGHHIDRVCLITRKYMHLESCRYVHVSKWVSHWTSNCRSFKLLDPDSTRYLSEDFFPGYHILERVDDSRFHVYARGRQLWGSPTWGSTMVTLESRREGTTALTQCDGVPVLGNMMLIILPGSEDPQSADKALNHPVLWPCLRRRYHVFTKFGTGWSWWIAVTKGNHPVLHSFDSICSKLMMFSCVFLGGQQHWICPGPVLQSLGSPPRECQDNPPRHLQL